MTESAATNAESDGSRPIDSQSRPGSPVSKAARLRTKRTLQIMAGVFVVNFFVVPQLRGVRRALEEMSSVKPGLLLTGLLFEFAAWLSYALLTKAALGPTPLRVGTILRIQMATKSLTNVVPGGSAAGPALGYRLFVIGGEDRAIAGFALALVGLGSAVLLNVLLWLTLLVSIPFSGFNPAYVTVALAGVLLMAVFAVVVLFAIRGADQAEAVVRRVARKMRFMDAERAGAFVRRFATRSQEVAANRPVLRQLVLWGSLNWVLDAAALWVFLRAFGVSMRPHELLVAFCVANVTAALPITPGGLGLFEGALGAALGIFGVPIVAGGLAISAYRLVAYWFTIPLGALCYLSLRVGHFAMHRRRELGRLRDEAGKVLATGESVYDWADTVAVPRVASAAAAAAKTGEVVILADRAEPGSVRVNPVEPPANAPRPSSDDLA